MNINIRYNRYIIKQNGITHNSFYNVGIFVFDSIKHNLKAGVIVITILLTYYSSKCIFLILGHIINLSNFLSTIISSLTLQICKNKYK